MLDSAAARGWRIPTFSGVDERPERDARSSALSGGIGGLADALPIVSERALSPQPRFAALSAWLPPDFEIGRKPQQPRNPRARTESEGTDIVEATPPCSPQRPLRATVEAPVDRKLLDFEAVVTHAVETANPTIDLAGRGLESVPASIGDLSKIVLLPMLCTPSSGLSSSGGSGLQLFLSNNRLVSSAVSAALFRVQSLRILTLRENALDELPSAIGLLSGLRELSIGGNRLRWLPHELNALRLDVLTVLPNPFEPCPADASLGPLQYANASPVPTLVESATRRLLQPAPYRPAPRTLDRSNSSSFSLVPAFGTGPRRNIHDQAGFDLGVLPAHLRAAFAAVLGDFASPVPSTCPNPQCGGRAYIVPQVTRIEWRKDVAGCSLSEPVPIRWRGCRSGCLGWLDRT